MEDATLAKKAAALEVCRRLLAVGELDSTNLLPKTRDSWSQDIVAFLGGHKKEEVVKDQPLPGTTRRLQRYCKEVSKGSRSKK